MARDQVLELISYGEWKRVTDDLGTDTLSHYVKRGAIVLRVGDAANEPNADAAGWGFAAGYGELDRALSTYSPSGERHVWMKATTSGGAAVLISHA